MGAGAQEVSLGVQYVEGQAAYLSAASPVGTASAQGLAEVALPAVTYAQGTVHKGFDFGTALPGDGFDLRQGEFPGQYQAGKTGAVEEKGFFYRVDVCLGAGM